MGSKFSAEFRLSFFPDYIISLLLQSLNIFLKWRFKRIQSLTQDYNSVLLQGEVEEMLIRTWDFLSKRRREMQIRNCDFVLKVYFSIAEYRLEFLESLYYAGIDTHWKLKCDFSEKEDIAWAEKQGPAGKK